TDLTDTVYHGDAGRASWQSGQNIDAKGLGQVTNLAAAIANDFDVADLVRTRTAAMTTPDLQTLVALAGDVLGAWGYSENQTGELTPVLVSADGTALLDRAIYVEDASGGYWTLKSGAAVLDADGHAIARPTMEQVLAQLTTGGAHWQLEQAWSPTSRGAAVAFRQDAPYLAQIVDGRVVVLDHGIQDADGSWRLASGTPVTDADGNVIAHASVDDIVAMAHPAGQEWRVEALGFNPYANVPVQQIGVNFVNGSVVDYTVQVTDRDGTFYVWARNLDRALALQAKVGNARDFNLRNFEVDFATIHDQVGATDDSQYRVELLTPDQFHFALSLSTIQFQPQMLSASIDDATGVISYSVNQSGQASLSDTSYVSGIAAAINLLDTVVKEYVTVSRAM